MTDIKRDVPEVTLEITMKWDAIAVARYRAYMGKANSALVPPLAERPDTEFIRIEGASATETSAGNPFFSAINLACVATDFEPLAEEVDGTQLARVTFTAIDDATFGKCTISTSNQLTAADLPVV
jgi:hypothetical protein